MKHTKRMPTKNLQFKLYPTIAFTAVVILLMRAKGDTWDFGDIPDLPDMSNTVNWDVFCAVKSSAVFLIAIWAAITMGYLLMTGRMKIKKTILYIPMGLYAIMVLVSYAMSEYQTIAWKGGVNRYEGTRTILCYIFLLFYTINVIDHKKEAMLVVTSVLVSVLIECLIGLTQMAGHDILLSKAGNLLIAGGQTLTGRFESGSVYQTVYNMNYVGMYLALVVPFLCVIFLEALKKHRLDKSIAWDKKEKKILTGAAVMLVLIALNVYGADSLGGVVGIAVSVCVLLLLWFDKISQKVIMAAMLVIGGVLLFVVVYQKGTDVRKQIDYFETGDDYVEMSLDKNVLRLRYDRADNGYQLIDSDGNPLQLFFYEGQEGIVQIDDDRFRGKLSLIPTQKDENVYVIFDLGDMQYTFRFTEDGAKYLNPYDREVSLSRIESIGFEGHLIAGTGRAYIWSRTLPLLKGRLIAGTGADTFALYYPQNDYAGKYTAYFLEPRIIDKPHNMYLLMAVCTGGISCIAFLFLAGIYLYQVLRRKEKNIIAIAIAAGIAGFLAAGLFNDSTVCIMPMFYGLLGVGIALNYE